MSGNKVIKSVSLNITNDDDLKILEKIKDVNFSGYVKRLILEDIKRDETKIVRNESTGGIKIQLR